MRPVRRYLLTILTFVAAAIFAAISVALNMSADTAFTITAVGTTLGLSLGLLQNDIQNDMEDRIGKFVDLYQLLGDIRDPELHNLGLQAIDKARTELIHLQRGVIRNLFSLDVQDRLKRAKSKIVTVETVSEEFLTWTPSNLASREVAWYSGIRAALKRGCSVEQILVISAEQSASLPARGVLLGPLADTSITQLHVMKEDAVRVAGSGLLANFTIIDDSEVLYQVVLPGGGYDTIIDKSFMEIRDFSRKCETLREIGTEAARTSTSLVTRQTIVSIGPMNFEAVSIEDSSTTATVVITTYNTSRLTAHVLTALTMQSYPRDLFDVVVSDDGSCDDIRDTVSAFKHQFTSLTFLDRADMGFRLASARNLGILASQGDVIVSLDGDVIPHPSFLYSHLRWFDSGMNVATMGYLRYVNVSNVTPLKMQSDFSSITELPDYPSASNRGLLQDRRLPEFENFHDHPMPFNCFHGGNCAFRRRTALRVGLFDESFDGRWGYEDLEFGHRLWADGVKLIPEACALGFHCESDSSESPLLRHSRNQNFDLICAKIPGFREVRDSIGR